MKRVFFPHHENDHVPHLLREAGVVAIVLISVGIFGLSLFQSYSIRTNGEGLAAILPAVLTDLANADRGVNNLETLTWNDTLAEAARLKAEHMAEHGYFSHTSPEGLSPWYWFYRVGYSFRYAGENLAVNFSDSADVEQAWMNSPGHRANILNEHFTEIGISAVPGTFQGRPTIFVVQLFGSPSQRQEVATLVSEQVAGAETEVIATPAVAPVILETIAEDELFVAVEAQSSDAEASAEENADGEDATLVEYTPSSTVFERLATQPATGARGLLIAIGLLVAIVLLLMVVIEIKKQSPRHIVYGVILLILVALLVYLDYLILSKDVLVL